MPSASSIQRMERTPPEVSGLVEEERLQRGVEECNHQMVKVLHLWCGYLHSVWTQNSGCKWFRSGPRISCCYWFLWRRPWVNPDMVAAILLLPLFALSEPISSRSSNCTLKPEGVWHWEQSGNRALGPSITQLHDGRTERIQGVYDCVLSKGGKLTNGI